MYDVTFQNTGSMTHDLTFADGTKIVADGRADRDRQVTVPADGLTFLCSIPGHADAGMKGAVIVGGAARGGLGRARAVRRDRAAAPVADPNAPQVHAVATPTAPQVMLGHRP